jgi:VanZ family protein
VRTPRSEPAWRGRLAAAAALAVIAAATLIPVAQPDVEPLPAFVWLGGLADVLRNVALFLPLGAAGAWLGLPFRRALPAALGLSAAIELVQLAIPGRFTSPFDVVSDGAGAALGWGIVYTAEAWLRPPAALARRLERAFALAAALLLAGSALLLLPAPTAGLYFAHLPPRVANLFAYDGTIDAASLAGTALANGPLGPERSDAVRSALAGDFALRFRGSAGRPGAGLAGLVFVSDERDRAVLLAGLDGEDLVLRWRGRADALGLESPTLRVEGAWHGVAAGSPVAIEITRSGASTCIALATLQRCELGFHAGSGWQALLPVLAFPPGAFALLDFLWVAALAAPLGLWARGRGSALLAAAVAAAPLALLPALVRVQATPLRVWLTFAGGWLVGHALARWLSADSATRAAEAHESQA